MKKNGFYCFFLLMVFYSSMAWGDCHLVTSSEKKIGLIKDNASEIAEALNSMFKGKTVELKGSFEQRCNILAKKTVKFFTKFEKKFFKVHTVYLTKTVFYSSKIPNLFFFSLDAMRDGSLRELSHLVFCYDFKTNDFYRFRSFTFEARESLDGIYIIKDDINTFNQILKKRMKNQSLNEDLLHNALNLFIKAVYNEDFFISDLQISRLGQLKKSKNVLNCLLENEKTKEKEGHLEIVLSDWRIDKLKISDSSKIKQKN